MKNYARTKGTSKQVRYRTPSRFIVKKTMWSGRGNRQSDQYRDERFTAKVPGGQS